MKNRIQSDLERKDERSKNQKNKKLVVGKIISLCYYPVKQVRQSKGCEKYACPIKKTGDKTVLPAHPVVYSIVIVQINKQGSKNGCQGQNPLVCLVKVLSYISGNGPHPAKK